MDFSTLKATYAVPVVAGVVPTHWQQWLQRSRADPLECVGHEGWHQRIGYRILQIPLFDESSHAQSREEYHKSLLRQKAFLDTVSSAFLAVGGAPGAMLELRLLNNPATRVVDCYLLLRKLFTRPSAAASRELVAEFERILPDDYILQRLPDEAAIQALVRLGDNHLVEVRKDTRLVPVGGFYSPDDPVIAPPNLGSWDEKTRFYLPCSHYIPPSSYSWLNLFKMLQAAEEGIQVRLSLATTSVFEVERNLALQYHAMLAATYRGVANQDVASYQQCYAKYLSASSLFTFKIQVAAPHETQAMAVANACCTQLSFGQEKTRLICHSLCEADRNLCRGDWEEGNHYCFAVPGLTDGVPEVDPTVAAFTRRLPYLADEVEATALFRLPVANAGGLPGVAAKPIKPFYQPTPRPPAGPEITLGEIVTAGAVIRLADGTPLPKDQTWAAHAYSFPVKDLTKHGLIVGSTGSGKTNTTLQFVKALTEQHIPFLLIEPVKSEYYAELLPYFQAQKKVLHRFNFRRPLTAAGECHPEYLRFNPLLPMPGISVTQHISYIKGCFNAAFPMHGIMPLILEECLNLLYQDNFWLAESDFFDPTKSPVYINHSATACQPGHDRQTSYQRLYPLSLAFFDEIIKEYTSNEELFPDEKTRLDFGSYLQRRFVRLTSGLLGNALCPNKWVDATDAPALIPNNMQTLLTEPTIIELEDLADNEEKALMMAFLMTYLFEYRQTQPSATKRSPVAGEQPAAGPPLHITLIEEAHRLLSSGSGTQASGGEEGTATQSSQAKAISLFIDMLAEIRAKGEGIFIVEQIPTKLIADVIKNTNLKIMHRITSKDDRDYLGTAMSMNDQQKNYVNNLKTGEAIIFDEQLDNPVFVKVNPFQ
ncbi:hypothetical protein [Hymenobacter sp. GOD-10R]|uniref:ATP-binding protein n=1 Tax=Hymenobacter sp. GOD-10R TaxID=3093922 RepID=UPI002D782D4F|nr:hypothetical protein [Hymenobacter sp. GOD-10R]WRQ31654.1 hypothetical protein SD425_27870 [Hymenobacter sp. GOD-10R]